MTPSPRRVAARWLQAEIQPVPRKIPAMLEMVARRTRAYIRATELILAQAEVDYDSAKDWLSSGTSHDVDLHTMKRVLLPLGEFLEQFSRYGKRLQENIDDNSVVWNYVGMIHMLLTGEAADLAPRLRAIGESIERNQADLVDQWTYVEGSLDRRLLNATLEIPQLASQLVFMVEDAAAKFGELLRRRRDPRASDGERLAPPSNEIETLFHTTVNAKTLLTKGFDLRGPSSVEGIGGSQSDAAGNPAISFTSDLYVAKEIMRCLREVILISQGEVTLAQVFEWADKDGVGERVRRNAAADQRSKGAPSDVFEVYSHFLATSPKRYNPVFWANGETIVAKMRSRNPREVGILACRVHMKHPAIAYLSSMEEYRVPAEAVVSIDRIIG